MEAVVRIVSCVIHGNGRDPRVHSCNFLEENRQLAAPIASSEFDDCDRLSGTIRRNAVQIHRKLCRLANSVAATPVLTA
jgi:hypothetical protein